MKRLPCSTSNLGQREVKRPVQWDTRISVTSSSNRVQMNEPLAIGMTPSNHPAPLRIRMVLVGPNVTAGWSPCTWYRDTHPPKEGAHIREGTPICLKFQSGTGKEANSANAQTYIPRLRRSHERCLRNSIHSLLVIMPDNANVK